MDLPRRISRLWNQFIGTPIKLKQGEVFYHRGRGFIFEKYLGTSDDGVRYIKARARDRNLSSHYCREDEII